MRFRLNVDGRRHEVDVPENTPLLWVLRDDLGLTGTKYGCGVGACGACTVHVQGEPTRSCSVPVKLAADKSIDTIEGTSDAIAERLRQAWIEEDVAQCGYCQGGHIMTAAALLRRTPQPTDAQIDAAMSSHICRCGTFSRIRRAIHRAAGAP